METFSIFAALLCAIFGLYFVLFLVRSILTPLKPYLKPRTGQRSKGKLRRKQQILAKVDQLIEAEKFEQAYEMLCEALVLDGRIRDKDLLSSIGAHHMLILNKTLLIADLKGKTLTNLPVLEDLLSTRIQLCRALMELQTKQTGDPAVRTETPSWAKKAFREKEDELNNKLETNLKSIHSQFNAVKKSLFEDQKEEYHYH